MKEQYAFSVVTAVYNVAPFLQETYHSLLKQDIGFPRIQWILCDDGSTDDSPKLCDAIAGKHPDQVVVIHKENGGVSTARNAGLGHVRGKYVSFLDADDLLSKDALSKVYALFEAHPETDVVSLPMFHFDGEHGPHTLNDKFEKGTRVIDLVREPKTLQLSFSSAFVRAAALRGKAFDTDLKYAEDAKLIQTVLLEKQTLGVVADARHLYRRRSTGQDSAMQRSRTNRAWYHDCLNGFALDLMHGCLEKRNSIPLFVQHAIAYELQWRVQQQMIPSTLFDASEKDAYLRLLREVYSQIDDDVIVAQKDVFPYQSGFALYLKHGSVPEAYLEICRGPVGLDFFTVRDGVVTLECGLLALIGEAQPKPKLLAQANGVVYEGVLTDRRQTLQSLGAPAAKRFGYTFRIPLPDRNTALDIRILREKDGVRTPVTDVSGGQFFPVSEKYEHAYAVIGKRVLTLRDGRITLSEQKRGGRFLREVRFLSELLRKKRREEYHAVVGRLVYAVCKPFQRKPRWLLSDRVMVAGDNGEAMFRYLEAQKAPAKLYFAVSRQSPDYAPLKKIGRVVDARSVRHKLLFLLSDLNISSQADSDVVSQFSRYDEPYRDIESRIRFVFLQHGVIKDDLSVWLNRYDRNIAGFVTSGKAEADSIRDYAYGYPDSAIWLTGLPRFDRLCHDEKRCITIMPTWRQMWVASSDPKTSERKLMDGFEAGAFYRFFNALLNDERLLDAAKKNGYTIRFLPHPNLQLHVGRFTKNDDVVFLPAKTPYRKVFAESDLVLTDYSSVAFDFAYLRKPVIYAQFDRDAFFSGEHMYVPGYFDYERDGFGEVETTYEATVDRLIEYMENGCKLKDEYRARIDGFFAFNDRENCRRVFEKLLALQSDMKQN